MEKRKTILLNQILELDNVQEQRSLYDEELPLKASLVKEIEEAIENEEISYLEFNGSNKEIKTHFFSKNV